MFDLALIKKYFKTILWQKFLYIIKLMNILK
jgi:hypothetical protein